MMTSCLRSSLQTLVLHPEQPAGLSEEAQGRFLSQFSLRPVVLGGMSRCFVPRQDSLTVVVEDLRLCSVKPFEDIERRFCFEVVSPFK